MFEVKLLQEFKELKERIEEIYTFTKPLLTLEQAAKYLDLSKSTLYKMNLTNCIPFYKPNNKTIYYERLELDNWLRQNCSYSSVSNAIVKPRKSRGKIK